MNCENGEKLETLLLKNKYILWQHHRDRQGTGDVKLGIPVLRGQRGVEGSETSRHSREGAFTSAGVPVRGEISDPSL